MNKGRPKKIDNMRSIDEVTNEVMDDLKSGNMDIPEPNYPNTPVNEPSIQEDSTAGGFNPLAENVIQRDYSNPPIDHQLTSDIDEPIFVPPSYDDNVAEFDESSMGGTPQNENPFINPNPAVNELDPQDQKVACEMLVDTILDGYEQLHEIGKYVARVDEGELIEKQMQGKIDLQNQQVPISEDGTSISLGEFVQTYNNQASEALTYDKEFGKKVRPAMVRLFTKNGWGMSDGQYLGFMFGKDIITKGVMIYQMKKAFSMTLEQLEKQYKREKQMAQEAEEYEQPSPATKPQTQRVRREKPTPIVQTEEVSDEEVIKLKRNAGRPKRKNPAVQKMNINYPNPVKPDPLPKDITDEV